MVGGVAPPFRVRIRIRTARHQSYLGGDPRLVAPSPFASVTSYMTFTKAAAHPLFPGLTGVERATTRGGFAPPTSPDTARIGAAVLVLYLLSYMIKKDTEGICTPDLPQHG